MSTLVKKLIIVTAASIIIAACSICPRCQVRPGDSSNLDELAEYMTGFFSSKNQSLTHPHYYDIHLHMVRIWPDQKDGYWLYVEQSFPEETPYRQRIYNVIEPSPGIFASIVYELPEPESYAGQWNDPEAFGDLKPETLINRIGCAIYMVRDPDGTFRGGTHEKDCLSELRGAAYAVSQVRITADMLMSWDRGYDENDQQVWGTISGGYRFDKIENFPVSPTP